MPGFPPVPKAGAAPIAPNADHKTPHPKPVPPRPTAPNPPQGVHSTGYKPRKGVVPAAAPMAQGSRSPMPMGSMVAPPDPKQLGAMRAAILKKKSPGAR